MALVARTSAAARFAAAALLVCALAPVAARAAPVAPPIVTAFFAQEAALPGADVGLGFTVLNADATTALTGVAFSATLPAGLVVSSPSQLATTCDGTATATDGGAAIGLSGATLQPAGEEGDSCAVLLDVVAPGPGVVNVAAGPAGSNESGPGSPSNTTSLQVIAPPTIAEAFAAASIDVGATTSVTYTLDNPNASTALYNLEFDDTLPAGLRVASPANVGGTCLTHGSVQAPPGGATIALLGLLVAAGSGCSFSVDVTATGPNTSPNPTGPLSFAFDAGGGDFQSASAPGASATLVAIGQPALTAAFAAATLAPGATTTLTFTLANPNPTIALTGIGFTDTLPAGMIVATPNGLTGACGAATITAAAGSGSIALADAALAPGAGCTFAAAVRVVSDGQKTNTTSTVSSDQTGPGSAATSSLIVASAPSIRVAFGAASIALATSTSLTFTIANPNAAQSLSALAFSSTLPPGLTIAAPIGLAGTCGGSVAIAANGAAIALTGGTLAAQGICTITVNATGTSVGPKTVGSGPIGSSEGGAGAAASGSIAVVPALAGTPPSNAFKIARLRAAGDGTVRFDITVPGPGDVKVLATLGASSEHVLTPGRNRFTMARKLVRAAKAGTLRVTVRPNARAKRAIRRAGRSLRANVWISYRPRGGSERTVRKRVVVRPR